MGNDLKNSNARKAFENIEEYEAWRQFLNDVASHASPQKLYSKKLSNDRLTANVHK